MAFEGDNSAGGELLGALDGVLEDVVAEAVVGQLQRVLRGERS